MAWWRLRMIHCYRTMHDIVEWPKTNDFIDAGYCLDRFTLRN